MILRKEQLRCLPVAFAPILDPALKRAQQAIWKAPWMASLQFAEQTHPLDVRALLQQLLDLLDNLLKRIITVAPGARLLPRLQADPLRAVLRSMPALQALSVIFSALRHIGWMEIM